MINFSNRQNLALKIQAAKQVYLEKIVPQNHIKPSYLNYVAQNLLASQIKAMAEQDKRDPVGRKFNVFA